MSIRFLCISIVKEIEMEKIGSWQKNLSSQSGISGKNNINFLFSHFFLVPQKDETFLRHLKEVRK